MHYCIIILLVGLLFISDLLANNINRNSDFTELLAQGERLQSSGFSSQSNTYLTLAYEQATTDQQRIDAALLLMQNRFEQGDIQAAESLLQEVLAKGIPTQKARGYLQLADNYRHQGRLKLANKAYQIALTSPDAETRAVARLNSSKLKPYNEVEAELLKAKNTIAKITKPERQASLYASLGLLAIMHNEQLSWHSFNQALALSHADDDYLHSQIYGYQAQLYQQQRRIDDAIKLSRYAILIGQSYPELLMLWEWQLGKLLKIKDPELALQAYRRAINHLEHIRSDISIRYKAGHSSFRQTMEPLYLELADLLLSTPAKNPAQEQILLKEVQQTIEAFKTAELQDYFKDSCAVTQQPIIDLGDKLPRTAIIYPIIFPDRLEILLGLGNQFKHYSIAVTKKHLHKILTAAVKRLRPTADGRHLTKFSYQELRQLHQWLIEPLEADLVQGKIHTLVYVPDGRLRTLPISTLWNGHSFLIERYAIATVSGLSLLDPNPLPRDKIATLLAGISKPGRGSVQALPTYMKKALLGIQEQSAAKNINPSSTTSLNTNRANKIILTHKATEKIQDSLSLPGVEQELQALSTTLNTKALHNKDFKLEHFARQLNQGARIVHIASHGLFTGDPKKSFIMTHDRLMDMNMLEELFKSEAFSDAPVELLTLSACQTAEGNDRAPLGLAGIALKSGVRSIW